MMSESDAPFEAEEAQATPPPANFPEALISTISAEDEEDDEWEYEYSTTETETYYVTLDLTTPDLPARHKPAREDGPKRARWTNPGNGRQARSRGPTTKVAPKFSVEDSKQNATSNSKRKPQGSDQEDEGEDDENDGDANENDKSNIASRRPTHVQILNLDSDNPVVAYGGHFYSCQWASNIGTEMLFTERKTFNALPALRQLPDNVDLLAASSARIISKHVQLMPKKPIPEKRAKRKYKRARFEDEDDEDRVIIPVGKQASDGRKEQAAFLSQMIRIKEEQGDEDMVTVNVRKRLSAQKWLIELQQIRREERGRLREIIENGDEGDEDVEAARETLKEMEEEDKEQGWVETQEDIDEEREARAERPKTGPGSRGGKGKARRGGAAKSTGGRRKRKGAIAVTTTANGKRRGRPRNFRPDSSTAATPQEGSVDMDTPGDFSEQFSADTPSGFDSNVAETSRDFGTPMDSASVYGGAPTPSRGTYYGSPLDGESPSQQLFHDMGLHGENEDAPGEEDDEDLYGGD